MAPEPGEAGHSKEAARYRVALTGGVASELDRDVHVLDKRARRRLLNLRRIAAPRSARAWPHGALAKGPRYLR